MALLFAAAAVLGRLAAWLLGPPSGVDGGLVRGLMVGTPAVLLASWVMMSVVESRSLAALGLVASRLLADTVTGLLIGGLIVAAAVGLLALTGGLEWSYDRVDSRAWLAFAARMGLILALAAFFEELLFRGYAFQLLAEVRGPLAAVGVTAVLFGAAHGANPGVGPVALLNTTLAGILLGTFYWRTFSLWLVTAVHSAWNAVLSIAADLPVSGLDFGPPGLQARVTGPELWTGGSYGPEGGLALTLVTVVGIAWSIYTPRLRREPAVLALHPLPWMRLT